jgi:hypothetical protein
MEKLGEDVVRMARALCTSLGNDPDVMVYPHPVMQIGAKGHSVVSMPAIPSWQLYLAEARVALDTVENP